MVNGLSDIYLSTSVVKSESTGVFAPSPSERRTDSARELRFVGIGSRIGSSGDAFGTRRLRRGERDDGILPKPLSGVRRAAHNGPMERATFQMTVGAMLAVVACIALNFWLFRLGVFWGILGLNVTKHVVIAYLCQVIGVDRRSMSEAPRAVTLPPPRVPVS